MILRQMYVVRNSKGDEIMGLRIPVEKMSEKKLEDMRRKAFKLQGIDFTKAMFEYHDSAVEYWDSQWGNSLVHSDGKCIAKWTYHSKQREVFYEKLNWRSSNEL